jgi:hypothetical protein
LPNNNSSQSLETAAQFPETADLVGLCEALELAIADQPLSKQLQVGGNAIAPAQQSHSPLQLLCSCNQAVKSVGLVKSNRASPKASS